MQFKGGAKVIGIGEIFKATRLKLGLSLTDVENETKIRSKYLEAIEEENFELIPGRVYLKGFIRTYAKYLGIDDNEEIVRFLEDFRAPTYEIEKEGAFQQKSDPKGIPRKYITVILGIVAILVLLGVQNFYEKFLKQEVVAPPVDSGSPIVNPPSSLTPEPVVTPENELPQKKQLIIEIMDLTSAKEACWVRVHVDDNLAFEGTLYQGEQKSFEAQEKIKIKLGNAGAAKLILGENDLGTLGNVNQVVEKEFILSDYF